MPTRRVSLTLSTGTWEAVGKRTAKMNAIVGLGLRLRDRTPETARSRYTSGGVSSLVLCACELGPHHGMGFLAVAVCISAVEYYSSQQSVRIGLILFRDSSMRGKQTPDAT